MLALVIAHFKYNLPDIETWGAKVVWHVVAQTNGFYKNNFSCFQTVEASMFTSQPIIFGDYIKVGADKVDRMYEDLSTNAKVKQVLADVSIQYSL